MVCSGFSGTMGGDDGGGGDGVDGVGVGGGNGASSWTSFIVQSDPCSDVESSFSFSVSGEEKRELSIYSSPSSSDSIWYSISFPFSSACGLVSSGTLGGGYCCSLLTRS